MAEAIAIDQRARIVVVGKSEDAAAPPYTDFAVARYGPNGMLDSSFGSGGLVTTPFPH